MTQQNSALVEESAAASEGLRDQARHLDALISQFVLPGDAQHVATPGSRQGQDRAAPAVLAGQARWQALA
jgi:hypothetical protein